MSFTFDNATDVNELATNSAYVFDLAKYELKDIVGKAYEGGKFGTVSKEEVIQYLSDECSSDIRNGIEQKLTEAGLSFGYTKAELYKIFDDARDAWNCHRDIA